MRRLIYILTAVALLTGCKTRERIVEHVRTDTLIQLRHEHDSIYLHDSTYVRDRGDTIYIERWHTAWRDRVRTDTVRVSHTDSVPVPYAVEVIKEVERSLTWWQTTRLWLANIMLVSFALCVIIALWRHRAR